MAKLIETQFPFDICRSILWIVSNCASASRREDYVKELSKYIRVDIYGKCSSSGKRFEGDETNLMLDYKYYLAFENSKCDDYVTEKLFKILHFKDWYNAPVPVVLGSNKTWYEKNLPSKSFIHVDDFPSPEKLAQFLKLNTTFEDHTKWRLEYEVILDKNLVEKLCVKLHEIKRDRKSNVIDDFPDFWLKKSCYN